MSQKTEKPVLKGQRIKTRKRDEREKYDASAFRDAILQGVADAETLEDVSRFLDKAGSQLDYRRYAETLFDILFAGGILAPGGFIRDGESDSAATFSMCVFRAEDSVDELKAHYEVFYKLIRRYKYLEKSFEENLKKLIMFLRGFSPEERKKLAQLVGICLANSLPNNASCLSGLFEEHLVKEGLAIQFTSDLFRAWLSEKDMQNLGNALKKAGLETKLLQVLPINKRTQENFENHFASAGLHQIVEYQRHRANAEVRKDIQRKIKEMINEEESVKEMIDVVKGHMAKFNLSEPETVVLVWNSLMAAVEWNKKEEMVADQSIRHLKAYTTLLGALTASGRAQLSLIQKIQEYCFDNMTFMKVFQKIIILLYKADVVSEEVILKWYKDAHHAKGKTVFLQQMKQFVEWLENAEEESEEDED